MPRFMGNADYIKIQLYSLLFLVLVGLGFAYVGFSSTPDLAPVMKELHSGIMPGHCVSESYDYTDRELYVRLCWMEDDLNSINYRLKGVK